MNKDNSVHVATGVWYELSFGHAKYRHFPCEMQYDHYATNRIKYISALESCEPVKDTWGADYDKMNGTKTRTTKELIDLTKDVCDNFIDSANLFAEIELPMLSISMQRLIDGATCYQGLKGNMSVQQDYAEDTYNFIYNKANCIVTPSNISDVLKKKIEHVHVVNWNGILWNQQSKLDPNTSLYVYNYDKYDDGGVYVKILKPNTDVVNANLCLISPEKTRHIPSTMAELFRQKNVPIIRSTQSRNR